MDLWLKYYGERDDVPIERIAEDAEEWLKELFGQYQQDYNRDSLSMFYYKSGFMEHFLCSELEKGVIKLIFPRELYGEDLKWRRLTWQFLIDLHNAKLHNESAVEALRDNYKKCSFVLNLENGNRQCVWNGEKFSPTNPKCTQIGIKVVAYRDSEIVNYDEYIPYLMKKERNSICEFTSSTVFWNNVVGFSRGINGNDTYFMEKRPVDDKDLMLLCLALGFDHKVYDKLLTLRKDKFKQQVIHSTLPQIGSLEISFLRNLLMDSHWRFLDAKSQVKTLEEIPRRMLVNANVELLQKNWKPIIHLSDAEVKYTKRRSPRYFKDALNEFYERGDDGYKLK